METNVHEKISAKIVYCPFDKDEKVGLGKSSFVLNLSNGKFVPYDVIESEKGILCRVLSKGTKLQEDHFVYSIIAVESDDYSYYCPMSELQVGQEWAVQIRLFPE